MKSRFALSLVLALAAYLFGVRPAFADIYTFKDEHGVVHFTNIKGLDPRYRLLRKEGSSAVPGSHGIARAYMPSEQEIARYAGIIETAARAYGVDKALVHAVVGFGSTFVKLEVFFLGTCKRIHILHDKFTAAKQPALSAQLVAELVLDLVNKDWEVLVRVNVGA